MNCGQSTGIFSVTSMSTTVLRRFGSNWGAMPDLVSAKQAAAKDPSFALAHYNLALIYERLGERELAAQHRKLHERYRPDDNARDRAVAIARRRDAAADHAAQATVIYSLQRDGAFELKPRSTSTASLP